MQPELNVGLFGHVDHGKTSLTYSLTGKWTDTHSEELKRGISIKLGYADYCSYRCLNCGRYQNTPKCQNCNEDTHFLRKVSILDAPGHETLMATAIATGSLIDGALLVIAANEPCPRPQTLEHMMVLKILNIMRLVVVQNKIDLVSKSEAINNYRQIKSFLAANGYEKAPIIPTAAHQKINIDRLIEAIEREIPTPKRDLTKPARMYVARSFDINKPGSSIENLKGGVLGGSIVHGRLKVGEQVEVLPMPKDYKKLSEILEIENLYTGNEQLQEAKAGGLIAVSSYLDPYWTKSDAMIGSMIGHPGTLPVPQNRLTIEFRLLEREENTNITLTENEPLVINAGTTTAVGFVKSVKKNVLDLECKNPICVDTSMTVAISKRIKQRWRLVGFGRLIE